MRQSLALPDFPTLKNIQGLAQFDMDRDRSKKRKAIVMTNLGIAKGEYNVDFVNPEPGDKVQVYNNGRGRE